MKIYLVQHSEALSPEIDSERPLSPEGRNEMERLSKFLGRHSFPLTSILHSPKLRAKQTAEILRDHLASDLELEEHSSMLPNDPIDTILTRLNAETDGCMVVGHLPFLNKLCGQLVASDENVIVIKFIPGKVVCLEADSGSFVVDWAIGTNLTS